MQVKGIRWIGVGTASVAPMRSFAIDVLGIWVAGQDGEDFVEIAMGDGAKLELFGTAEVADGPWLFASNPVAVDARRPRLMASAPGPTRRRVPRR